VETSDSPFTCRYSAGEIIRLPIAHKEGRYVASPDALALLNRNDRVAFRFCTPDGMITPESNPNGSAENITGVLSEQRNVLLMMPHPERASEDVLGSPDGRRIFDSMIAYIEQQG